jgi:hypothetical protein
LEYGELTDVEGKEFICKEDFDGQKEIIGVLSSLKELHKSMNED